jgi:hypothetical protein
MHATDPPSFLHRTGEIIKMFLGMTEEARVKECSAECSQDRWEEADRWEICCS